MEIAKSITGVIAAFLGFLILWAAILVMLGTVAKFAAFFFLIGWGVL